MSRASIASTLPGLGSSSGDDVIATNTEYQQALAQFQSHLVEINRLKRKFADYQADYKGLTFRPSTFKNDVTLQFVAVNLHRQLTTVSVSDRSSTTLPQVFLHDIITFGAPTDHLGKSKHGLLSMRAQHAALMAHSLATRDQASFVKMRTLELQITQRFDICIAQALGALITALASKLQCQWRATPLWQQIGSIGILVHFESLLSTISKEKAMLEDMAVATTALSAFRFQIVPLSKRSEYPPGIFQLAPKNEKDEHEPDDVLSLEIPKPKLLGIRKNAKIFIISMGVTPRAFARLPPMLQRGSLITVHPMLFTQGINETQSMAIKLGQTKIQEDINAQSWIQLKSYYDSWLAFRTALPSQEIVDDPLFDKLSYQMDRLEHIINTSKREKNVELLPLAADISRKLGAARLTSCKSAKDRTAMSVTWEQARILNQDHALPSKHVAEVTKHFRSHGVRRENAFKNTGSNKFAFNKVQLLYLPEQYRAPFASASGKTQT